MIVTLVIVVSGDSDSCDSDSCDSEPASGSRGREVVSWPVGFVLDADIRIFFPVF